ncbi:MAG: 30S ribosome-binding factor RbfA [Candidatus Saganbacteria bacterium]|nr:30S ribosome-binding factor RbfA [Candidatus Saganbacteria bacterium]
MSTRTERLSELVKEMVSGILRKDVSDPRIGFVSITDVKFTEDLKFARIYVSIYGGEEAKTEAMAGLKSATRFIRSNLAQKLDLRIMPDINFICDDSIEKGSRVLALMERLNMEKKTRKSRKKK